MKANTLRKVVIVCALILLIALFSGGVLLQYIYKSDNTSIATAEESDYEISADPSVMPIDYTRPAEAIEPVSTALANSSIQAVYIDETYQVIFYRDSTIKFSTDSGKTWAAVTADECPAEEFSLWLYENDPCPGYSMTELQNRLANGAHVQHITLSLSTELYCVSDGDGAQLELVQQPDCKEYAIFLDGVHMVLTSKQIPYTFRKSLISEFYQLLIDMDIVNQNTAKEAKSELLNILKSEFIVNG